MLCIRCRQVFPDGQVRCPHCEQPVPAAWEHLKTVYPPEDDLIRGLLESCGIPVVLLSREGIGRVQGIAFGPLAEIRVMVPQEMLAEARAILGSREELGPPENGKHQGE